MKKFFAFLAVTLSVVEGRAQANVYHPFPDSAIWRVDVFVNSAFNGGCFAGYYFHYYTSGDTLINSIVHRKLYKSFVYRTSSGPMAPCDPIPPYGFSGYVGALRDDSVFNKVFFVFPNTNNDALLYNYNLNVGDTIKGFITNYCNTIILSEDSVLISGQYRRRWNCNACGDSSQYIIQGTGTSYGLIEKFTNNSGSTWSYLICVKDSSSTLFVSGYSSAMGCNLILTESAEVSFKNNLQIFPNPSTGIFTLTSSEKFSSVEISDVLGNVVKKSNALTPPSTPLGMTFDLSFRPKGIYFIKVMDEKGNFGVKKIILL
jgi:hypothetical protein